MLIGIPYANYAWLALELKDVKNDEWP
jgi:hypothetical protein